MSIARICKINNCHKAHFGLGLCNMHYSRLRRNGDANKLSDKKQTQPNEANEYFTKMSKLEIDKCILWKYNRSKQGYGRIRVNGKNRLVHRLALSTRQKSKPGQLALHSCNNPPCFNYRHLRWGSYKDNMLDKVKAGNAPRGEKHHFTKITEQDLKEIRESDKSNVELAKIYNMSRGSIWRLRNGYRWGNVVS